MPSYATTMRRVPHPIQILVNAIHDAIGTEINGACIGTYARDPYLPRGSILPKLWPVGLQAMVRKYP